MMAQVLTVRWIVFLFASVIFCISAEVDADVLKTTIVTENGETIELKWVETEQFLANENLPIWTTTYSHYHLIRNTKVMQELGPFKSYYDLDKSSAILVLKDWDCIYGVIDVRYTIVCLPLHKLVGHQHKIGESQYVMVLNEFPDHNKPADLSKTSTVERRPSTPHKSNNDHKMLIKTFVDPNKLNQLHLPICDMPINRPSVIVSPTSSAGPPKKKQRVDVNYKEEVITVYPEILIFVSHEIVSSMKLMSTLILRYLVNLNAVAMLFTRLETHNIKIRINMAGIVIDSNGRGFPPALLFEKNRPEAEAVLDSVERFIQHATDTMDYRRLLFPVDSFDMFLYSTTKEWAEREKHPHEYSTDVFNMRSNRILQNRGYGIKKNYLGSIVDSTNVMQHYVNAARAVARLMSVKYDTLDSDVCLDDAQCSSVMQTQNGNCANCLTWSQSSVDYFKDFLSTSMNRCYLRNLPRSLHPYGVPRKSLIPADQCLCYGYAPDMRATTHLNNDYDTKDRVCQRMIQCSSPSSGSIKPHFAYPIDGTPCDKDDDNKVCWNSKCVSTRVSIYGESLTP